MFGVSYGSGQLGAGGGQYHAQNGSYAWSSDNDFTNNGNSDQFYGLIGDENDIIATNIDYDSFGNNSKVLSACAFAGGSTYSSLPSTPVDEQYRPLVNSYDASPSDVSCTSPQSELSWDFFHQQPQVSFGNNNHNQIHHGAAAQHPPPTYSSARANYLPPTLASSQQQQLAEPTCELFASEALRTQAANLNSPHLHHLPRPWTVDSAGHIGQTYLRTHHVKESLKLSIQCKRQTSSSNDSSEHSGGRMPNIAQNLTELTHDMIGNVLIKTEASPEDDERRRRRRERNKVAATKCRHKKKAHVCKLGIELELLTNSNEALRRELIELKAESDSLVSTLAEHRPYCRKSTMSAETINYT